MKPSRKQFIEYTAIVSVALIMVFAIINDAGIVMRIISRILGILSPFIIGFVIAYLLNAPITYMIHKLRFKRATAIGTVYLSLVAILVIISVMLVPTLANNILNLINDITNSANNLPGLLNQFDFGTYEDIVNAQMSTITDKIGMITNSLLQNLVDFFITVTTTFFNLILGLIISIYMLIDKDKLTKTLKNFWTAILKPKRAAHFFSFLNEVNAIFSHFLIGLIVEAVIIGILAGIGFSIMHVKYAIVLGTVICLTNMIPYFGAFIGAVPAIFTAFLYDPVKAVWVAVFIIVLQQVDGNVIGPRIMGSYIGLDPIWIILAITVGGGIGGLLGMVLAIPLGAIIKLVLSALMQKRMLQIGAVDNPPEKEQ